MSDTNPDHLEPTTRARFEQGRFEYERARPDMQIIVGCTWRDPVAQLAAWRAGKSNARPGQSYHNPVGVDGKPRSYAIDFLLRVRATGDVLEGTIPAEWDQYAEAAAYFKAVGFVWSGDWHRREGVPVECGHINARIPLAHAHAGRTPEWPDLPPDVPPAEPLEPRPRYV